MLITSNGVAQESGIERTPARLAVAAAFPLALLLAIASLVGIVHPTTYVRETENWAAQAVGQDWVDLLFGVPWLAISAWASLRGSRRARILLAGGLLYTVYELVIYAFAVHFNALFLVYCASLGLSLFALLGVGGSLAQEDVRSWFEDTVPVRTPGIFLVTIGVGFALLWLAEIVPALVQGSVPRSVAEAGLLTNPVHVIDLSTVLPAHVAAGVLLLRRHRAGYAAVPVVLAFGVLMALSIAGMMVVMQMRGLEQTFAVAAGMMVLSTLTATTLVLMLRKLRTAPSSSAINETKE